jgi:hypothetical protein
MDAMMWWAFVGKMLTLILGIVGVVIFLIWLVDTSSKVKELEHQVWTLEHESSRLRKAMHKDSDMLAPDVKPEEKI